MNNDAKQDERNQKNRQKIMILVEIPLDELVKIY
jgi:hypothetical protein